MRYINKAVDVLKNGGVIIYPTDTVYGFGCDIFNKEALERIYTIKQDAETKLVRDERFMKATDGAEPFRDDYHPKGFGKPRSGLNERVFSKLNKAISKEMTTRVLLWNVMRA